MTKIFNKFIIVGALFVTSACGSGFRDAIGLKRSAPDEFRVVSNAPLVVPPEFTLRPPVPGEKRPGEVDLEQQAKDILFESKAKNADAGQSQAESIFLQKADIADANPDIKNLLIQEEQDALQAKKKKNFFEKAIILTGLKQDNDPLVNSMKEKERLEKNQKEGKSANEGGVAVIEQGGKGVLLNHVFGF